MIRATAVGQQDRHVAAHAQLRRWFTNDVLIRTEQPHRNVFVFVKVDVVDAILNKDARIRFKRLQCVSEARAERSSTSARRVVARRTGGKLMFKRISSSILSVICRARTLVGGAKSRRWRATSAYRCFDFALQVDAEQLGGRRN